MFSAAYLAKADFHSINAEYKKSEKEISKALSIDPNLPEAKATRAFNLMLGEWDWKKSEELFREASLEAPYSSKIFHWWGTNLSFQRRFEDAKVKLKRALTLDPTSLLLQTDLAEIEVNLGRVDLASGILENVLSVDPNFGPRDQSKQDDSSFSAR